GGVLGKPMHAPVDVGIGLFVEPAFGIDDGLRLLRGGAVVEIDQGLAPNGARENRKIARQIEHYIRRRLGNACTHEMSPSNWPPGSRLRTVAATRRRMGSMAMRFRAWA